MLGPRPAAPVQDPATQMSRARAAVLEQLGRYPQPTTVRVLAAACGQHPNTVREHLDALVGAGLADRRTGPSSGRGRPAILYSATPPETARPQVREYANLACALAGHLSRTSPDPVGEAIEAGRHWGQECATTGLGGAEAAMPDMVAILAALGYDPQIRGEEIRLRQCPLLDAAQRHPEIVCNVHLGLLQGIYDARGADGRALRIAPFVEPGACLVHSCPGEPGGPSTTPTQQPGAVET